MENISKNLKIQLLLGTTLWGLFCYLLWHKTSLSLLASEGPSFCAVNAFFNCDAVALSSHSMFLKLPTALWGMFFVVIHTLLACYAFFLNSDKKDFKDIAALLFSFQFVGILASIIQLYFSLFVIKSVCIVCAVTYVLHILMFCLSYSLWKNTGKAPLFSFKKLSQINSTLWILTVLLIGVHLLLPRIITSTLNAGPQLKNEDILAYAQKSLNETVKSIDPTDSPSKGPESAQITLVEFSDFQCPYCAKAATIIPATLFSHGDSVRWVFKNFPLDSSCNPEVKSSFHQLACVAAKAGRCVFKLKSSVAFFEFKSAVFKNQKNLTEDLILSQALIQGIPDSELKTCMDSKETLEAIQRDIKQGVSAGVQGTPAVYINGHFLERIYPQVIQEVIQALKK